jgi:hypothetical protein
LNRPDFPAIGTTKRLFLQHKFAFEFCVRIIFFAFRVLDFEITPTPGSQQQEQKNITTKKMKEEEAC